MGIFHSTRPGLTCGEKGVLCWSHLSENSTEKIFIQKGQDLDNTSQDFSSCPFGIPFCFMYLFSFRDLWQKNAVDDSDCLQNGLQSWLSDPSPIQNQDPYSLLFLTEENTYPYKYWWIGKLLSLIYPHVCSRVTNVCFLGALLIMLRGC